jgi:hypothetical protein
VTTTLYEVQQMSLLLLFCLFPPSFLFALIIILFFYNVIKLNRQISCVFFFLLACINEKSLVKCEIVL